VGAAGLVLLAIAGVRAATWVVAAYALAVAAGYALRMVRSLTRGRFGVDILAVVAIVSTVLVGEVIAAMIVIVMMSGGEALEDYAGRRARHELDALLQRDPRLAHRLENGETHDVPIDAVAVDDVLLVRPAEVIPVDGVLLSDVANLDQSPITGESIPVEKSRGEHVLSGSINGSEAIRLRATAVAADSQYQQIVALVSAAAQSKARVVRLADRYAVPFTVFSLLVGVVAWIASGEAERFAEVLVLATPCPLLIAAPVAFLGGMSRAARGGIIVRDGGVLERLARTRTVVFDKTGTLTSGRPALREVRARHGFSQQQVLGMAASAEQYSSHVLATSVVQAAKDRNLPLSVADSANEVATDGIAATFGSRRVAVGKLRFVQQFAPNAQAESADGGELVVYVAIDGEYAGALLARDAPRPNAASTLRRLRGLGVARCELLTGDAAATAAGIARELGIADFRAECLPADKVAHVSAISDRPVVMVGDGVNDAPVLASADVGIAMGARGATAASESADVVLLIDDIGGVAAAIEIGRDTVRIALQSIWAGILVSVVLMIIAAFGVIAAIAGALLQEAVDLVTILAALRAIGSRSPRG
jgi:heavy metal translocating P-type ATPase